MSNLLCVAHRGGPLMADSPLPENSLAAISRALDAQVSVIEIDIYQVEGELFVTHDRRLGKLVSGSGVITQVSAAYLRDQRLMNGESLPRLQDVLRLVGDKALLNIEIKSPECVSALQRQLDAHIREHQLTYEQFIVSSFDHHQLHDAMQLLPEVRRGVLIEGIPLDYAACCEPLKAYSLNTHLSFMSQVLVDDTHRRGYQNWVYTVNHEEDWQWLASMGVDAIFTDIPDKLMQFNARQ
jgi:glycerophosphoryl diester phosphodiesterase